MSVKNKWYLTICIFITVALLAFAGLSFPVLRRFVSAVVDLAMSISFCGVLLQNGTNVNKRAKHFSHIKKCPRN